MTTWEELRTRRHNIVEATKKRARADGKATGHFTNTITGLKERFTYVWNRLHKTAELTDVWTNAEEIYPPFRDRNGRIIRY